MGSIHSLEKASLLAKGTTADIYDWGPSHVLKLFLERSPGHANEVAASRIAHKASLPVPEVIDGLIEVSQREGIVLERVDGPTMTEYLRELPEKAERCARQAAELQARIHSTEVTDLPFLVEILTWSINQTNRLDENIRKAVLDVLNGLPARETLCHNDFYPNNIIMSPRGPVVIDWAIGASGNPLADHARTWLISRMWLGNLDEMEAPEHVQLMWQRFWDTFFQRYDELLPSSLEDFNDWQIVAATASLVWDRSVASAKQRVSFVKAALFGAEHPWLSS
jgi:tRNA A-37 threonylcarbamoyl transferase component Bud32